MNLKFSNKTFYKRHIEELQKYKIKNNSIHLVNELSKNKFNDESDIYFVNTSNLAEFNSTTFNSKFETIIISDIIEVIDDIDLFLNKCKLLLTPGGKLVICSLNTKYLWLIKIFEKLNLKQKNSTNSYFNNKRISKLLSGYGFEFIKTYSRQIYPFKFFLLGNVFNRIFELLLKSFNLGLRTYSVFRSTDNKNLKYKKTVIIPAKNEEGNLEELLNRIPRNDKYEIIFSCGVSKDNTYELAKKLSIDESFFDVKVIKQSKTGKANAVWEAAKASSGDLIAILDADISVEPETIPLFFKILEEGKADFVNGTRLIYDMEKGSMRFLNLLGNRFFQYVIGLIISTPLTDTLCGTKVFKKSLVNKIFWWQNSNSLLDPFGDFDLIFTAAYTSEKIVEFPIHYKTRTYGETQIYRFRDGFKLIKYMLKSLILFNSSKWS